MKSTFPENSKSHEEHIRKISDIILKTAPDKIAFIILFGSFARGSWVFHRSSEDGIIYEYASDYDFLVIKKFRRSEDKEKEISDFDLEKRIHQEINNAAYIRYDHNPHFVIEPLDFVNSELEKGRYFFSDIKKEGILLYDSGEFKLAESKVLEEGQRREIAKGDYEHWFSGGKDFLNTAPKFEILSKSAFALHQAAESFYNCALLVLTGYKPKSHDLVELGKLCSAQNNEFLTIFPFATEDQQESFKLLNKSYIEARYNKNFRITKEQLEYLVKRVEKLKETTEKICKNKI